MIGVAVSTHRRPTVLSRAVINWAMFMPNLLVVVHDERGDGVAATKNRGITALMDAGCTELFLADDDVWPIRERWWVPYITNPQPHLMHCWGKSRYCHSEGLCSVWAWPRGVLLYVTREVVERVGGMRREFGRWGGEHAEWSRRIHNAGFTTHPFQDAVEANRGVWHAEDYKRAVPSTVPASLRTDPDIIARRHALYEQYRHSTDFVSYRTCVGAQG